VTRAGTPASRSRADLDVPRIDPATRRAHDARAALPMWTAPLPLDGRAAVASSKASIDAQSDATLSRLYGAMPGACEMGATAKGIQVLPAVVGGSAPHQRDRPAVPANSTAEMFDHPTILALACIDCCL
jgi:hypothetical protein